MEGSVMIINVAYDHKKSFKKVKKESNKILGIKNKKIMSVNITVC